MHAADLNVVNWHSDAETMHLKEPIRNRNCLTEENKG